MAQKTPLLTVILPTYNIESYLRVCLDSVVNQTYKNLEIIIIDDNSSDGTPEIIKEYAANDDRIKTIFHKENQGPGNTRNEGLDMATGDYVTLMDHDDWQDLTKYEKMMAKANEYDVDFVVCNANEYKQNEGIYTQKPWLKQGSFLSASAIIDLKSWGNKGFFMNSFTPPWAKIIKKTIIDKHQIRFAGGDTLFDDMLFNFHLCISAEKAAYVPEVLYTHRFSITSISGNYRESGDVTIRDRLQTWHTLEDLCRQNNIDPRKLFQHFLKKLAKYAYRADNSEKYIAEIQAIINRLGMQKSDFPKRYRIYYQNVMRYSRLRRFIVCAIRQTKLKLQVIFGSKQEEKS